MLLRQKCCSVFINYYSLFLILDYDIVSFVGAKRKVRNGDIFWTTVYGEEILFDASTKVWRNGQSGALCIFMVTTGSSFQHGRYTYQDDPCRRAYQRYICERAIGKCFKKSLNILQTFF